jgi:tripeptide aminopeptidase
LFSQKTEGGAGSEGLKDVEMDDMGYIMPTLPATRKKVPTIGFISHSTHPRCQRRQCQGRVVNNYDGGDIELSPGIVSSPKKFPELLAHRGEDIIVTDGTTLLGADDKAGIAEIVQAMCYLRDHDEIKHGDIRVAFNPDRRLARVPPTSMWRSLAASGPIPWMVATSATGIREIQCRCRQGTYHGRDVHRAMPR